MAGDEARRAEGPSAPSPGGNAPETSARPLGSRSRPAGEVRDGWRMFAIWVVLSAIGDPLFYFLAGPHIPPGTMSNTADGAQFDFNVLLVAALPVLLAVWIYMAYAIVNWRASRERARAGRWAAGSEQPSYSGHLDSLHDGSRAVPLRLRYL